MDTIISGLGQGFGVALDPFNLFLVLIGCFAGTLVGALARASGPINGVAILLPIAYSLNFPAWNPPAVPALCGRVLRCRVPAGGSAHIFLLNVPGDAQAR